MPYEEVLRQLEDYRSALAEEDRLVRAGAKARAGFSAIREKHAELFSEETIMAVRGLIERAPFPKKRDQLERVLFALLEGSAAAETLPIEERLLSARAALADTFEGGRIPYDGFALRIADEDIFERREALRQLQAGLADQLTPLYLEREHASRQRLAVFGFRGTREYAETKKRLRYDQFLPKAQMLLEETTGLYRRVMSDAIRRAYGKELGEVGVAHAMHWCAGHEFDHLFPADQVGPLCGGAFATLGLPFGQDTRLKTEIDLRLQNRPRSGYGGLRAFLHEGMHTLRVANIDPALPYEWRGLPRSRALSETYACLIARLPENPIWLEHVAHVPKGTTDRLGAWALLGNLFRLRRDIAKFIFELAFDEKPYDASRNKELYAKTLKDLTGFLHEPEFWLVDMEADFMSADRLRAWIASAQLDEHLVRRFGDRWFLKRDAGAFLKDLFAKGDSWNAEELVQSLGMTAWDPLPLVRKFDGVARLLR